MPAVFLRSPVPGSMKQSDSGSLGHRNYQRPTAAVVTMHLLQMTTSMKALVTVVLYVAVLADVGSNLESNVMSETCQWEAYEPKCNKGQVVVMETATYGRMRFGRCVTEDLGHQGCHRDVLGMADRKCSGRPSCQIQVPDSDFETTKPCSELQSYLEAKFNCVKVEGTDRRKCGTCDYVRLTSSSGFIASSTTEETGCGSADCPWLIEAKPGQQIKIKLYDFAYQSGLSDVGGPLNVCRVYAVLKEETTRRSVTICGGDKREKEAYTTTSNKLQVRVLGKSTGAEPMYFMLHYTVIGCADVVPPTGGWFKRHGETGVVGCSSNDQTWRLVCNGTDWLGSYDTCPRDETAISSNVQTRFSFEISIAIVIIIAIIVGTLILIIGLICFRRHTPSNGAGGGRLSEEPPYETRMHPAEVPQYIEDQENMHNTLKSTHSKTYGDVRNEYAHIWEMPLPQPMPKVDIREGPMPPLPAPLPMPQEI